MSLSTNCNEKYPKWPFTGTDIGKLMKFYKNIIGPSPPLLEHYQIAHTLRLENIFNSLCNLGGLDYLYLWINI